jgi:hypothetical protein
MLIRSFPMTTDRVSAYAALIYLILLGGANIAEAQSGSPAVTPQTITVGGGGHTSSFQVTVSTATILNVVVVPYGLVAGSYLGVVSVEIPGVVGNQQYVPITFVVANP